MESFADGGFLEYLLAVGMLVVYRFIASRKWVKIAFSITTVISCIGVFTLNKGDGFYYVSLIMLVLNSLMLVSILWKEELEKIKIKFRKHGK